MAYDFLALTNEICGRLNETKLNSVNFPTAVNFYSTIKDSINAAIRDINHQQYNYPFNHNTTEIILDSGVARYPVPQNAKLVDFDNVKILRDNETNVATRVLKQIQYNEYTKMYLDDELNTATTGEVPRYVAKSKSNDFVIAPKPDKEYTLEIEYFTIPADLSLWDDVPTVPESFKHIILDGAMYHCYMFRDNAQSAGLTKQKFDEGLKAMRSLLVNEYINVIDTRVERNTNGISLRVN
tara:strand:+ start:151 stop:867 length:717 start_codon:yes stop_codon:yes gene_type:complete